jgi:hypothetical protein
MIPQSLCRVAHVHNMRAYAAEAIVVRDDDVNGTFIQYNVRTYYVLRVNFLDRNSNLDRN